MAAAWQPWPCQTLGWHQLLIWRGRPCPRPHRIVPRQMLCQAASPLHQTAGEEQADLQSASRGTGSREGDVNTDRKHFKSFNKMIGMAWPPKLRNAVKQKGRVTEHVSNSQRPCPRWWSQTSCLCHTGWRTACHSEHTCSTSSSCNDDEALMRGDSTSKQ